MSNGKSLFITLIVNIILSKIWWLSGDFGQKTITIWKEGKVWFLSTILKFKQFYNKIHWTNFNDILITLFVLKNYIFPSYS